MLFRSSPDGRTKMDWKMLRDCTFKYRPIVTFTAVSCTPKFNSIKKYLHEGLITSEVEALRAESDQKDIKSDDKLNQRFLDSLARIETQRKASLLGTPIEDLSGKSKGSTTKSVEKDGSEDEENDMLGPAARLKKFVGSMETME